ncbi:hypothetical protein ACFLQY_02640 [Verrucomicrobiota bacterium]
MTEPKTDKAHLLGTIFSVASGLGFFTVIMLLPLVGAAGSKVEYATLNLIVFMLVLLLTILFSAGSIRVTMRARKEGEQMKTPWLIGLVGVICTLLLLAKLAGLLKI